MSYLMASDEWIDFYQLYHSKSQRSKEEYLRYYIYFVSKTSEARKERNRRSLYIYIVFSKTRIPRIYVYILKTIKIMTT